MYNIFPFFPSVIYIYNLKNNHIENKTVAEKHNRFPTLFHPFTSPVIKKNLVKFRISRRPFALRSVTSLLVLHHRLRLLLAQHQIRNKMDLSLKKKSSGRKLPLLLGRLMGLEPTTHGTTIRCSTN